MILKTFLEYKVFPLSLSIDKLVNSSLFHIYNQTIDIPQNSNLPNLLIENPQNWSIFKKCFSQIKKIDLNQVENFDTEIRTKMNDNSRKMKVLQLFFTYKIYKRSQCKCCVPFKGFFFHQFY